ncbi:MAG TPA: tetratricopeptide repeat protein [Anaeromyxobacteraceae bacterium]|nr:tetratricopeptide repeat protein [Anaeromyxobacteraceae bacterium]
MSAAPAAPDPGPPRAGGAAPDRGAWPAALALATLVALAYGAVGGLGFVNFDDPRYVFQNPHVQRGLTFEGVAWAFTAFHAGNWHPLTWLSHMLDVELFGLDPGRHHVVNAVLHGAATLLLFGLLRSATGRTWPSALAAALFAVHPLHVESVAWISERKDVLAAVFWMLATWAYLRQVRRPGAVRSAAVAAAFALGLMSKPTVVTLPAVLVLLDLWPLGRISATAPPWPQALALVREKAPLLALSLATGAVTLLAQSRGEGVAALPALPVSARIGNAVLSSALYLGKTVWPARLAAVYPHPALGAGGLPAWAVLASALLMAALTALALWQLRRRPVLAVGWLWYLVALLPTIGLVQVGLQGMADRYTYLPLVGIFVALAWLAAEAAGASGPRRIAVASACLGLVLACAAVSRRQVETWRDSFTLFGHALEVTRDNWLALRNLGVAQQDAGRPAEAIANLEASLQLMPHDGQAWMNLGISYASVGRHHEAARCLQRAAEMRPDDDHVWFNLGIFYALTGQWDRLPEVERRLRELSPEMAERLSRRLARARGRE